MLTDIPDGSTCYLDATILYYHIVNTPPLSDNCSDLLARIEAGQVGGVTSAVAVAEATHKVMLAEIISKHGVDRQGLTPRLKRHPELLEGLTEHQRVAELVERLGVRVEPITVELLKRGAELTPKLKLLTNDALAVAVMERLGVQSIATNDDDFDKVSGIKVYKPGR